MAKKSLRKLEDKKLAKSLEQLLDDENKKVQRTIKETLKQIKGWKIW